jgi:hypothetical protein
MRKALPIAIMLLLLGGPIVPLVQAGDSGSSFSLLDKKTKKRAAKRWKRTQKDLRKNTKRYNKLGRKTIKRAGKNVRGKMKDWQKGR